MCCSYMAFIYAPNRAPGNENLNTIWNEQKNESFYVYENIVSHYSENIVSNYFLAFAEFMQLKRPNMILSFINIHNILIQCCKTGAMPLVFQHFHLELVMKRKSCLVPLIVRK